MKKLGHMLFLVCFIFILSACKGSKDIQGTWFATNSDNQQIEITITEKTISFSTEGQDDWVNDYVQTGTGFKNNTGYKTIKFDNTTYSFVFPDKKDLDNALILVPYDSNELNGDIYWVLSKTEFPDYKKYQN